MSLTLVELEAHCNDTHLLDSGSPLPHDAQRVFEHVITLLERGELRAARKNDHGEWHAIPWVKRAILLGFRLGRVVEMGPGGGVFHFFDKHTYPTRDFRLEHNVRVVPGGSTVRRGAYLAPGVVCMPPMYVNVGAYVGTGVP